MGVIYRRRPLSRPGLTGRLESPSHGSLQSGVGRFSGWVCVTGPGGEPPPPAVPEVAERYFYDALEHKESSVDNRGNWWARTGSTNETHITGRTTVQEVVDQVRRFTISYVDDDRVRPNRVLRDAAGCEWDIHHRHRRRAAELAHYRFVRKAPCRRLRGARQAQSSRHGSPLMSSQARP